MIKPEYFLKKYGLEFRPGEIGTEILRQINRAIGVYESYEGSEPYIFISYAHLDSVLVLPAIKAIQEQGYPVWYDAGISPGSEWAADISTHLMNASLVIAFVSENAFRSQHCKSEIAHAFNNNKPMLTVRLDKTPLPAGLDMQLSLSQMFEAFAYDDGDEYVEQLSRASIIPEKINPILKDFYETKRREEELAQVKKQQEEAHQHQLRAEQARRDTEEAEKAERLRREAEEAEKAERKRREAEEAKRQRAEAQKQREEANARKKEEAELKKQQEAEREKQKKSMQKHYAVVQAGLNKKQMGYYYGAINRFNNELIKCAKPGLGLEEEVAAYRGKLCQSIYQDACQMEKSRKTRLDAGFLFSTLPANYADAAKREQAIMSVYKRIDMIFCFVFVLLHIVLNVCLTRFVMPLAGPWYLQFLVVILPIQVLFLLLLLLKKIFYIKVEDALMALVISFFLTLIVDVFLFQGVDNVWIKILWSVILNGVGFAAGAFLWWYPMTELTVRKIQ